MQKKLFTILFIGLLVFLFSPSNLPNYDINEALAATTTPGANLPVTITNPLTGDSTSVTPQQLIGRIINGIMGLVGSIALAMFIYGGFVWMMAAGNEQNVQKGKDILTWATIGLVVIFSSYALVSLVFEGLGVT